MGHEIVIRNGEASMFYFGDVPWHGLGTKVDKAATAQEAILAARLNWRAVKKPLYAGEGNERVMKVPNRFAIVPEHLWEKRDCPVFGLVGREYTPLQNHEAFEFFDSIVGKGAAIYHTAGALGDGERIWILAKLPDDIKVAGEDISNKFLLLSNTHDGNNSVQVKFTPVRVVCRNTLTMALGRGPTLRVAHTKDIRQRLQQSEKLLGLIGQRFREIEQAFKKLVEVKVNESKLAEYLNRVFPDPKRSEGRNGSEERYQKELARVRQDRLWSNYFFEQGNGNQMKPVAGTLWAALQRRNRTPRPSLQAEAARWTTPQFYLVWRTVFSEGEGVQDCGGNGGQPVWAVGNGYGTAASQLCSKRLAMWTHYLHRPLL